MRESMFHPLKSMLKISPALLLGMDETWIGKDSHGFLKLGKVLNSDDRGPHALRMKKERFSKKMWQV